MNRSSTNANHPNPELHDQVLLCVTDLEDCCKLPHTVYGDWYYPNGSVVQYDTGDHNATFRRLVFIVEQSSYKFCLAIYYKP